MTKQNQSIIKQAATLLRQERIQTLGGFGNHKPQRLPDKTRYTRKAKHPQKDPHQGPFPLPHPTSERSDANSTKPPSQRASEATRDLPNQPANERAYRGARCGVRSEEPASETHQMHESPGRRVAKLHKVQG